MSSLSFNVIEEKKEKGYSQFVIEPLEPGFGHTLGVALRRVLLNKIEGAAITSIKIDGVKHMFSTISGMKEDVIEFILNLKTLQVRLADGMNEGKLNLSVNGPATVTAADIEAASGVEIANPDHYLASLADKRSKLSVEMTVERGLGYSLAEERSISTIGIIPIDAIFSPIIKVNYKVEQTRVGRQTNYDKLILEIWTNGTLDAREALNHAGSILSTYFAQVYEPHGEKTDEMPAITSSVSQDLLRMTVDELDLPTRIYNSLRNAGIETIEQLLITPKKDLMAYRNLGAKSLYIIEESLREKGIPFQA